MDVRALSEALGKVVERTGTVIALANEFESFLFEIQGVLDQMSKDERSESESETPQTTLNIPPLVRVRSLEEQLDIVLDNMEPSPAVDAMRNHTDVRDRVLHECATWIQLSYKETMKRLWEQWEDAERKRAGTD